MHSSYIMWHKSKGVMAITLGVLATAALVCTALVTLSPGRQPYCLARPAEA